MASAFSRVPAVPLSVAGLARPRASKKEWEQEGEQPPAAASGERAQQGNEATQGRGQGRVRGWIPKGWHRTLGWVRRLGLPAPADGQEHEGRLSVATEGPGQLRGEFGLGGRVGPVLQ